MDLLNQAFEVEKGGNNWQVGVNLKITIEEIKINETEDGKWSLDITFNNGNSQRTFKIFPPKSEDTAQYFLGKLFHIIHAIYGDEKYEKFKKALISNPEAQKADVKGLVQLILNKYLPKKAYEGKLFDLLLEYQTNKNTGKQYQSLPAFPKFITQHLESDWQEDLTNGYKLIDSKGNIHPLRKPASWVESDSFKRIVKPDQQEGDIFTGTSTEISADNDLFAESSEEDGLPQQEDDMPF